MLVYISAACTLLCLVSSGQIFKNQVTTQILLQKIKASYQNVTEKQNISICNASIACQNRNVSGGEDISLEYSRSEILINSTNNANINSTVGNKFETLIPHAINKNKKTSKNNKINDGFKRENENNKEKKLSSGKMKPSLRRRDDIFNLKKRNKTDESSNNRKVSGGRSSTVRAQRPKFSRATQGNRRSTALTNTKNRVSNRITKSTTKLNSMTSTRFITQKPAQNNLDYTKKGRTSSIKPETTVKTNYLSAALDLDYTRKPKSTLSSSTIIKNTNIFDYVKIKTQKNTQSTVKMRPTGRTTQSTDKVPTFSFTFSTLKSDLSVPITWKTDIESTWTDKTNDDKTITWSKWRPSSDSSSTFTLNLGTTKPDDFSFTTRFNSMTWNTKGSSMSTDYDDEEDDTEEGSNNVAWSRVPTTTSKFNGGNEDEEMSTPSWSYGPITTNRFNTDEEIIRSSTFGNYPITTPKFGEKEDEGMSRPSGWNNIPMTTSRFSGANEDDEDGDRNWPTAPNGNGGIGFNTFSTRLSQFNNDEDEEDDSEDDGTNPPRFGTTRFPNFGSSDVWSTPSKPNIRDDEEENDDSDPRFSTSQVTSFNPTSMFSSNIQSISPVFTTKFINGMNTNDDNDSEFPPRLGSSTSSFLSSTSFIPVSNTDFSTLVTMNNNEDYNDNKNSLSTTKASSNIFTSNNGNIPSVTTNSPASLKSSKNDKNQSGDDEDADESDDEEENDEEEDAPPPKNKPLSTSGVSSTPRGGPTNNNIASDGVKEYSSTLKPPDVFTSSPSFVSVSSFGSTTKIPSPGGLGSPANPVTTLKSKPSNNDDSEDEGDDEEDEDAPPKSKPLSTTMGNFPTFSSPGMTTEFPIRSGSGSSGSTITNVKSKPSNNDDSEDEEDDEEDEDAPPKSKPLSTTLGNFPTFSSPGLTTEVPIRGGTGSSGNTINNVISKPTNNDDAEDEEEDEDAPTKSKPPPTTGGLPNAPPTVIPPRGGPVLTTQKPKSNVKDDQGNEEDEEGDDESERHLSRVPLSSNLVKEETPKASPSTITVQSVTTKTLSSVSQQPLVIDNKGTILPQTASQLTTSSSDTVKTSTMQTPPKISDKVTLTTMALTKPSVTENKITISSSLLTSIATTFSTSASPVKTTPATESIKLTESSAVSKSNTPATVPITVGSTTPGSPMASDNIESKTLLFYGLDSYNEAVNKIAKPGLNDEATLQFYGLNNMLR